MQIPILVAILLVILVIILFKLIKHPFVGLISIVVGLSLVALAAAGFLIYSDVMSIKENALSRPSMCVLQNKDQEVLAGIVIQPDVKPIEAGVIYLDQKQISIVQDAFRSHRESSLISSSRDFIPVPGVDLFKIVTVQEDFLKHMPANRIQLLGFEIHRDDLISLLESKNVYRDLAVKLSENKDLLSALPFQLDVSTMDKEALISAVQELIRRFASTEEQLKGAMFAMALVPLSQGSKAETIRYVFSEFQNENIVIYPGSIAINLLKVIPGNVLDQIIAQSGNPLR